MKKILLALAILMPILMQAQDYVYTDATTLPVFGKVCKDTYEPFSRLPARLDSVCRPAVWRLGRDSAGEYVRFSSDAGSFSLKWTSTFGVESTNMSYCCVKGLALYVNDGGEWVYVGTGRPANKKNGVAPKESTSKISCSKLAGQMHEYMLYLSLYDGVAKLEIGVPQGCRIEAGKIDSPKAEKAVVMYGTSILQGASASHPGLCGTALLGRMLDHQVINLGFSGNALLDMEIAELMAAYPDPGVFVLDNMPNGTPELTLEKEAAFFRILRNAHPDVPVVFVECPNYPGMRFDAGREKYVKVRNEALRKVFDGLVSDGEKNIYYVEGMQMLGEDNTGTIEGTHFTDEGFASYAAILAPLLKKLLTLPAPKESAGGKGCTLKFDMKNSAVYPGTERTINVWVPDEYDGSTPACLIVRFDGLANLPYCCGKLISRGDMPVCIAVGIEPGKVYDESHDKVLRYNRSNEFDNLNGNMARFIEEELIPELCRQKTPDGRSIVLSKRPEDHAATGASSGGIAAFNLAWERPDLFSRVYTSVGTFVPFRYGDQFPGIIRKTEPKRIRVFFQDNRDDSWNPLFGSWFDYNQLMLSAMQFAGYEVDYQWDEGKHNGKNGNAIMEQVLQWLWKGWPEGPAKGVSGNATLKRILDPESDWVLEKEGIKKGVLLIPSKDGRSYQMADAKKAGKKYNPLEAIYPGGSMCAAAEAGNCQIKNYLLIDGKRMYGQDYYCLHFPPRQLAFSEDGYLYCACEKGIQVCDHNGRVRAILSLPCGGGVDSIVFADGRLYAIGGGCLWSRKLKFGGATPDSPTPKRESQG